MSKNTAISYIRPYPPACHNPSQRIFYGRRPKQTPTTAPTGRVTKKATSVVDTTSQIKHWMRVAIYERDLRTQSVYRLGTLYGQESQILANQVTATLLKRWALTPEHNISINRERREIIINVSAMTEIHLIFELPGNTNMRSLAQVFGAFCRQFHELLKQNKPAVLQRRNTKATVSI